MKNHNLKIEIWVLYGVLQEDKDNYTQKKIWTFVSGIYISLGCWMETNNEGFWQKGRDKRDFDKRVRLTDFVLKERGWLRVFWPPMRGASLVEWGFGCMKEESVWVWECFVFEWVYCVFENVFEILRFWLLRNRVSVTQVCNSTWKNFSRKLF